MTDNILDSFQRLKMQYGLGKIKSTRGKLNFQGNLTVVMKNNTMWHSFDKSGIISAKDFSGPFCGLQPKLRPLGNTVFRVDLKNVLTIYNSFSYEGGGGYSQHKRMYFNSLSSEITPSTEASIGG
jgi:hypothetical protein